MGMCFFFGGLRRQEQYFNTTVAQTAASLLALAVAAVIVPTVFDIASTTPQSDVAKLSRGTSVILLFVYAAYLFFQLHTHSVVFAQESQKVEAKPFRNSSSALKEGAIAQGLVAPAGIMGGHSLPSSKTDNERVHDRVTHNPNDEDEGEEPQLHFIVAVATLAISTAIIAVCAEFMVDGISAITEGGAISAEFVGLILLPLVGNAAEHATAVTVAIKDKMDLAIGVAVGSSMQVALFIIPLLVIIGWGMGMDEMSLSFDPFQVAVLFVAVLLVNYLIADGQSHWLEGMLLMCLYAIIAVCSWCKSAFISRRLSGENVTDDRTTHRVSRCRGRGRWRRWRISRNIPNLSFRPQRPSGAFCQRRGSKDTGFTFLWSCCISILRTYGTRRLLRHI